MKTIGLIGGITWLSTQEYYRLLNQLVNERMGGMTSAKIILISLEFAEIKRLTEAYDWNGLREILVDAAKKLENAGADCLVVCANTMHKLADSIQDAISIPLIHIAEETGKRILTFKLKKVALLGTKYTMQLPFYKNKLGKQGIETIIPDPHDMEYINDAIYTEMGKGIFLPERKKEFISIINRMIQLGAQGIALACTEIPLLIKQEDISVPVFDTTLIHATAAVNFALVQ